MERAVVCLMSGISLRTNLYMTREDHVFIANVVVTNPTQEIMVTNVISRLTSDVVELNTIVKINQYREFHEGHHFIPLAMEVHSTPDHDMDCLSRSVFVFSTINTHEIIYLCFFASDFLNNMLILLSMCFSFYYRGEDCVGKRCLF
jgi:hypothetical protein